MDNFLVLSHYFKCIDRIVIVSNDFVNEMHSIYDLKLEDDEDFPRHGNVIAYSLRGLKKL